MAGGNIPQQRGKAKSLSRLDLASGAANDRAHAHGRAAEVSRRDHPAVSARLAVIDAQGVGVPAEAVEPEIGSVVGADGPSAAGTVGGSDRVLVRADEQGGSRSGFDPSPHVRPDRTRAQRRADLAVAPSWALLDRSQRPGIRPLVSRSAQTGDGAARRGFRCLELRCLHGQRPGRL